MTSSTTRSSNTTRTAGGRFAIGNGGGPGRPRRQTETAYLQSMLKVVTLDTWEAIITAAVEAAKAGDHKAREWLARYLVGEPQATAPTPTAAVVEELLGIDAPLDKASSVLAKPVIDKRRYPMLHGKDEDLDRATVEEARLVILSAETHRTTETVSQQGTS